jgi:aspartate-semialdehyde dehydrogenase
MEELSLQTLALLSQNEAPQAEVFPAQVAFDCFPHRVESEEEGDTTMAASEAKLVLSLGRSLGTDMRFSATSIQVPAFAGEGSALCVQTRDAVSADSAARWLEAAPGICLAPELSVASTREAVGSEDVWVARVRPDGSSADPQRSLLMWLSADPVRLAAQNALALARARFLAA